LFIRGIFCDDVSGGPHGSDNIISDIIFSDISKSPRKPSGNDIESL
jgi:hypothetical protein